MPSKKKLELIEEDHSDSPIEADNNTNEIIVDDRKQSKLDIQEEKVRKKLILEVARQAKLEKKKRLQQEKQERMEYEIEKRVRERMQSLSVHDKAPKKERVKKKKVIVEYSSDSDSSSSSEEVVKKDFPSKKSFPSQLPKRPTLRM